MNAQETKIQTVQTAVPRKLVRGRHFLSCQQEGMVFLSVVLAFLCLALADPEVRSLLAYYVSNFWRNYLENASRGWVCNSGFYAALGIAIFFEMVIPAKKDQKIVSVAFLHDGLWTLLSISLSVFLLPICIAVCHSLCHHLSIAITPIEKLPQAARWVLAFLIGDFLAYAAHVWRHKSRVLWQFHSVHHSQTDLNFFSESRRHPIDQLVVYLRLWLPFVFFHLPLEAITATYVLRRWHERLYHSNIKTNLGLLRYFIVTPQSHRIHHSIQLRHQDKNFGETLSIWDHLFGTQCKNYDEYPPTGIQDLQFPIEQDQPTRGLRAHLSLLWRQLIYPVKVILRS